jgi:histidinol-phosphatase
MYEEELAFAMSLADEAAEIAMSFFRGKFEIMRKADHSPVTEADLQIESMVRHRLAERFPEDAILGEEEGVTGSGARTWILDPIDGTKNFADGIQIWATLIALAVDGRPVMGVVGAPGLDERYEAIAGSGAKLNGVPIHVSDVSDIRRAMVVYGSAEGWLRERRSETFVRLLKDARRSRGVGDFWGHMLVARGAADVMIERELRTWDTAAVQVVVEEAGGTMTALDGSPISDHSSALSTNGKLHDDILARFS